MHFIRHAERLISCVKLQIPKTKGYQLPEGRTAQLSLHQWPVPGIRWNRCFKARSPAQHFILPGAFCPSPVLTLLIHIHLRLLGGAMGCLFSGREDKLLFSFPSLMLFSFYMRTFAVFSVSWLYRCVLSGLLSSRWWAPLTMLLLQRSQRKWVISFHLHVSTKKAGTSDEGRRYQYPV